MDHLVLPDGEKHWIMLAYDCPEARYYENIPDNGFEYPEFYRRVGWTKDEAWFKPIHNEDLLGGVIEGEETKIHQPMVIEKFFQTWLIFGLIIEVFALSDIQVKTSDFLAPIVRKGIHNPQTARLIKTGEKLPDLIQQWRKRYEVSRDETVFHKALKLLDHVGEIVDYHCANGKDHRSIHQYGKVLWSVSDETTTAIIAVAFTLRKATFSIYSKLGNEARWPITNSLLLYRRIQRKWCSSDAAMIMEDFDIDGQAYFAAATGRTLEELDRHYACTDRSCEARISDGTYTTQHDQDCHQDDYESKPKFLGHVFPEYGKSPTSLREAIIHIMDKGQLPVLRWDTEQKEDSQQKDDSEHKDDSKQKGFLTYGHQKNSYAEDSFKVPPFIAISHV
jgi:hypothetical protein